MNVVHEEHNPDTEAEEELFIIANALTEAAHASAGVSSLAHRAMVILERIDSHAGEDVDQYHAGLNFWKCVTVFRILGLQWFVGGGESEQQLSEG